MPNIPADTIRELFAHMEWADAAVWRSVLAHPPAAADESLVCCLTHLHTVQRLFVELWQQAPVDVLAAVSPAPKTLDAGYAATVRPTYERAIAFADSADETALARPVVMPWLAELERHVGRTLATPTVAETMLQVASHSTYHRGQVNARLRAVGGEPPLVDYIAWIWFGRPAPEWDAAPA